MIAQFTGGFYVVDDETGMVLIERVFFSVRAAREAARQLGLA